MPTAEEIMEEIKGSISSLKEQQAQLQEQQEQLTDLLTYKLENPDNPSALCEAVLAETPACQDFSGIRRWSACKAWSLMEDEEITWQEAITKAWDKAHEVCSWEPKTEAE